MKGEINTCAFIDVLGYRNIVTSNKYSDKKKIEILSDIYLNLFAISANLKEFRRNTNRGLFMKSFSDSAYIQSSNTIDVLYSCYRIFNNTLDHHQNNISHKYTPLLRCGIAKDWTLKIMDTAALMCNSIDDIRKNDSLKNIIGLGVAKAYETGEESKLSGMRIIISKEVMSNIDYKKYDDVDFECYYINSDDLLSIKPNSDFKLFFIPIKLNEKNETVDLFEMAWCVQSKFSFDFNENPFESFKLRILKLQTMNDLIEQEHKRHLKKTAEIIYKSYQIMKSIYKNEYETQYCEKELLKLINI